MKNLFIYSLLVISPFMAICQEKIIYVHPEVTTHILLPASATHLDVSTSRLALRHLLPNLVQLKPMDSLVGFAGVLTVIGEERMHQWEVYIGPRQKAHRLIEQDANLGQGLLTSKLTESDFKAFAFQMVQTTPKKPIQSRKHGLLELRVNALRILDEYVFLDIELFNNSSLAFDLRSIELKRTASSVSRRTNYQEVVIAPSFILNTARPVQRQFRTVVVVPTSTLYPSRELTITLGEQAGGRSISLALPYRTFLKADAY